MQSKITEAIHQLKNSITSLTEAVPAVHDTIEEKNNQIEQLRETYIKAHTSELAGVWNINQHNDTDYHLTGWRYNNMYVESIGDPRGNALAEVLCLSEDYVVIYIPYNGSDTTICGAQKIALSFHLGNIELVFYGFSQEEMFSFLKENNMTVKTPYIDESIINLKQQIESLCNFKQGVINSGTYVDDTLSSEMVVDGCSYNVQEAHGIESGCHPPLEVVEQKESVIFNAEEVSAVHKHLGVIYDYFSATISEINKNPEDDKLIISQLDKLFRVQTELDHLAVEIGDLDTTDEPKDLGMAGCKYWNMLQAEMLHLDSTINYIIKNDYPSFSEVIYRLNKLSKNLKDSCNEFENTWMNNE